MIVFGENRTGSGILKILAQKGAVPDCLKRTARWCNHWDLLLSKFSLKSQLLMLHELMIYSLQGTYVTLYSLYSKGQSLAWFQRSELIFCHKIIMMSTGFNNLTFIYVENVTSISDDAWGAFITQHHGAPSKFGILPCMWTLLCVHNMSQLMLKLNHWCYYVMSLRSGLAYVGRSKSGLLPHGPAPVREQQQGKCSPWCQSRELFPQMTSDNELIQFHSTMGQCQLNKSTLQADFWWAAYLFNRKKMRPGAWDWAQQEHSETYKCKC